MFRALVKAWRAAMKWFAIALRILMQKTSSDDDMTLEEKEAVLEKLSITN